MTKPFDLRALLAKHPADEQPRQELVLRLEQMLEETADVWPGDLHVRGGGGSWQEGDLRLEASSTDRSQRVVIQMGSPVEYIYYSFQPANLSGDPVLSKTRPVATSPVGRGR